MTFPFAPVDSGYPITSLYGEVSSIRDHVHGGIDFGVPAGTEVYAVDGGIVEKSGWTDANGNWVKIRHPSLLTTAYLHLSQRNVDSGDLVTPGQVIGLSGNTGNTTGPHLHFEVRDAAGETFDPGPLLPVMFAVVDGGGNIGMFPPGSGNVLAWLMVIGAAAYFIKNKVLAEKPRRNGKRRRRR